MLRNFDENVKAIDGTDFLEAGKAVPITRIMANTLIAQYQDEQGTDFVEKEKRCSLARKIIAGGDVDLSVEELTMLRTVCGKGMPTFVCTQFRDALEKEIKE